MYWLGGWVSVSTKTFVTIAAGRERTIAAGRERAKRPFFLKPVSVGIWQGSPSFDDFGGFQYFKFFQD